MASQTQAAGGDATLQAQKIGKYEFSIAGREKTKPTCCDATSQEYPLDKEIKPAVAGLISSNHGEPFN